MTLTKDIEALADFVGPDFADLTQDDVAVLRGTSARKREFRRWRVWTAEIHANEWTDGLSFGFHLDWLGPFVDVHFLRWIITLGRDRRVDIPGFGEMRCSAALWLDDREIAQIRSAA